ncbi:MAG: sulfotransferase [Acidobacteria bacterium]|nr:sulfotransferase [Acidobacteriota bacterium]
MPRQQSAPVTDLLEAASATTGGLDDFGDPSFLEGLETFTASCAADGRLSEIGTAAAEGMALGNLVNRLRVIDWHRTHPELAEAVVESPIILIGLPRTGTTALSHLLSVDPALRSLLGWEINESVPPPTTATYRTDPRFVAAMEAPDMLDMLNPEFKAIHHDPPDMPLECATVLGQHFTSLHLATTFNIDGYMQWVLQADHRPAYGYHRLVLQLLQSQCPGRWQLKSPVHLLDPTSLAATYPDARYVLTHRDPVEVIASVCSLVRSLTSTFTDADFHDAIRGTWPEVVATLLDRQLAFRDAQIAAGNGAAFVDIAYADLVAEPLGTVAAIYDAVDQPFTAEAEAAMVAHSAEHRQHRFGSHAYSLEDWGLSRPELEERCAPYLARYAEFLED